MPMLRPLAATLAVLVSSAPALAQDYAADNATDRDDWSGFYVGGALGYAWQPNFDRDTLERLAFDTNGDGNFNDGVRTATGGDAFAPGFCRGETLSATPGSCKGDDDGRTSWRAHAGFDLSLGRIVVGGVVEGGQTAISNSVSGFSTTPASYTFTRSMDWDGAARARIGFALPTRTLVYGTGGVAYARFKNSFATSNTFNSFTASDDEQDEWGWVAGGGIEQRVTDRFSIGVLYKYTRFDTDGYTVNAGQGTPPSATNPFVNPAFTNGSTNIRRTSDRFEFQTVQATVSFRF